MSDQIVINVVTDPPTNITISDTGENIYLNPLTLNQGIINHSVTHQSGGSDVLFHNLLGGLSGGSSGAYFHLSAAQYENLTTGSVVRPSDTGAFYPASNPSGFITGVDLSSYATISFTTGISGSLQSQITTINNTTGIFVTESETGLFYPSNNPSGFITGVDLSAYVTGDVVRPSETGVFVTQSQTGQFYPASNPSGFITGVNLSSYATTSYVTGVSGALQSQITTLNSQTGSYVTGSVVRPSETGALTNVFYPRVGNPSQFITNASLIGYATTSYVTGASGFLQTQINTLNSKTGSYVTGSVVRPNETGIFITQSQTGQFYPSSNPSGFLTGVNLSGYVTGDVVRPSETGVFITQSQTGQFYAASNPSGFITGVDLSNYATIPYTTGISGDLQNQINSTNQTLSTAVFVTGNQDISGLKDFQTRPTVLDVPVLVSGDAVDTIHLYGKNDQGTTIYKGQPVYINSANGANPLIQLASNTGERTSSKTIGLLAQDLLVNEFGYIITEGMLEGFDTSSGAAGDPMWLGPTGNIIYGLANKPYGNNHLVALGIVLRSNSNNGKVYVKVQNGFEIDELHKVYALNPSNKDTLLYDSGSGAWFARQLNTGDVSGINNYVLNSETGAFYPASNPNNYATVVDPVRTTVTGNGVTSGYAISGASGLVNPSALIVAIDGILQEPVVDYTVGGGNITFTSPLPSGSKAVVISPTNTLQVSQNIPADGSVTSNKIASGVSISDPILLDPIIDNGLANSTINNKVFVPTDLALVASLHSRSFSTSPPVSFFNDFDGGTPGFSVISIGTAGTGLLDGDNFGALGYGIQRITTGNTSGSVRGMFARISGSLGAQIGMRFKACFAIEDPTSCEVMIGLGWVHQQLWGISYRAGQNGDAFTFIQNQQFILDSGTYVALENSVIPQAGNFTSGKRYIVDVTSITSRSVRVIIMEADWNVNNWTVLNDNVVSLSQDYLGGGRHGPCARVTTRTAATRSLWFDWFATEHLTAER